jgi:hypothetical protein
MKLAVKKNNAILTFICLKLKPAPNRQEEYNMNQKEERFEDSPLCLLTIEP